MKKRHFSYAVGISLLFLFSSSSWGRIGEKGPGLFFEPGKHSDIFCNQGRYSWIEVKGVGKYRCGDFVSWDFLQPKKQGPKSVTIKACRLSGFAGDLKPANEFKKKCSDPIQVTLRDDSQLVVVRVDFGPSCFNTPKVSQRNEDAALKASREEFQERSEEANRKLSQSASNELDSEKQKGTILSRENVSELLDLGIDPSVVAAMISAADEVPEIDTNDVIEMTKAGVDPRVIEAIILRQKELKSASSIRESTANQSSSQLPDYFKLDSCVAVRKQRGLNPEIVFFAEEPGIYIVETTAKTQINLGNMIGPVTDVIKQVQVFVEHPGRVSHAFAYFPPPDYIRGSQIAVQVTAPNGNRTVMLPCIWN